MEVADQQITVVMTRMQAELLLMAAERHSVEVPPSGWAAKGIDAATLALHRALGGDRRLKMLSRYGGPSWVDPSPEEQPEMSEWLK